MRLGRNGLFSLLVGIDLLTSVLELTHTNFLYTTTLLAFGTCILLPGFLISLILQIRKISFWENLLFIVGLSIAFLEFGGLFLNILEPLIGVKNPLALQNLVIGFDIYFLVLLPLAWSRTEKIVIKIPGQLQLVDIGITFTTHTKPNRVVKRNITQTPEQAPPSVRGSGPATYTRLSQFAKPRTRGSQFAKPGFIHTNAGSKSEQRPTQDIERVPTAPLGDDEVRATRARLAPQHGSWQQTPRQAGLGMGAYTRLSQFIKPDFIDAHNNAFENLETMTSLAIVLPKRSRIEKVLYVLPIFFPILATLGAIMLNNGGSNMLTLILLGSIAGYSLFLMLFHQKIGVNLYPYALFFIGLASLFTTSLRSWYITGHDIEREFYVFQLTNAHHMWNMAFYQDAYNACLSITILPTILTNLLSIQDIYIYKVVFQILFATSPILAFFIIKHYTTPVLAFLSAFMYIAFPTFFNDMAMLNRQEIAFIFFGLVLYMLLLPELSLGRRKILFIVFALSVAVSHYSTNFVLLGLLVSAYSLTFIISRRFVKTILAALLSKSYDRLKNTFPNKAFLTLPVILTLILMTFYWNTAYTNSSNHAGSVLATVISSIFVKSNNNAQSSEVSYSIFSFHHPDPKQQLQDYIKNIQKQAETKNLGKTNKNPFYSTTITDKYLSYPVEQDKLAPTPLGNLLTSFHIPVFTIQSQSRSIAASFMQIFVLIGLATIIFIKKKKPFDLQYLLLCFIALFALMLITVLPALSVEYGLLRMFQQFLFILALPIVLGLNSVLFFVKEQKRMLFIGVIVILLFLNLTGFISHLTGDYYPQMTLDNSGSYYDAFYVHKADIVAIVWLSENDVNHAPIQADLSGTNKILTYGGVNALDENMPALIQTRAYVYEEISVNEIASINQTILIYSSSKSFLDENKDLLYSNGKDNIYK